MTTPDLAALDILLRTKGAEKAAADLAKVERAAKGAASGAAAADKGFTRLTATSGRMQTTLTTLTRTMGPLLATFAAFRAVTAGVRAFAEFEQAMAQVRGIAIKTTLTLQQQTAQFKLLENQAQKLGATTRFTATEAAQAQLFLARAGFEVKEIYDALPGVLDLAAAGAMELGDAADIASNILQQFNLDAKEMGRVGDVLVKTANSTNTNVQQMADAFRYAGPVAGALGIEIEELAAAVGVLGNAGIQATLAGTQLRGIMLNLIGPTKQSQEALDKLAKRLGTDTGVFDPAKQSLNEIFEAFNKAGAGAKEFRQIFGRRQAAGAIVFAAQAEKAKELTEALQGVVGETKRLADIQNNTMMGSFRNLKSAAEAMAIALGKSQLGQALRDLVDFLTAVFRSLAGVEDESIKISQTAKVTADVLRGLALAASTLAAIKLAGWFLSGTVAALKFVKALATLKVAMLSNPFTAIAVVLAFVIGLMWEFRDVTFTIGSTTTTITEMVTGAWEVAKGILILIWDTLKVTWELLWTTVVAIFESFTRTFSVDWERAWFVFGGIMKGFVNFVIGLFRSLLETIIFVFERMKDIISAFGKFNWKKPFESMAKVGGELAKAMNPQSAWKEVKEIWGRNFTQDFLGEAMERAKNGGEEVGVAFMAELEKTFKNQTLFVDAAAEIAEMTLEILDKMKVFGKTQQEIDELNAAEKLYELESKGRQEAQFKRMKLLKDAAKELGKETELYGRVAKLINKAYADSLKILDDQMKEFIGTYAEYTQMIEDDKIEDAAGKITEVLAKMRNELSDLGLDDAAAASAAARREFDALLDSFVDLDEMGGEQALTWLVEFEDLLKKIEERKAFKKQKKDINKALEELKKMVDEARTYLALMGQTDEAKDLYDFMAVAVRAFAGDMEKVNEAMRVYADLLIQIKMRQAQLDFDDLLKDMREQVELIGKTERQKAVIEATRLAIQAYGDDMDMINAKVAEYMRLWDLLAASEGKKKLTEQMKGIIALSDDMAAAFGDAFTQFVFGELSAEDAARQFGAELTRIMFQHIVAEPLIQLISNSLTDLIGGLNTNLTFANQIQVAGTTFQQAVGIAGTTFTTSTQTATLTFQQGVQTASLGLISAATQAAAIMQGAQAAGGVTGLLKGAVGAGLGVATGGFTDVAGPSLGPLPLPAVGGGGCGPGG